MCDAFVMLLYPCGHVCIHLVCNDLLFKLHCVYMLQVQVGGLLGEKRVVSLRASSHIWKC